MSEPIIVPAEVLLEMLAGSSSFRPNPDDDRPHRWPPGWPWPGPWNEFDPWLEENLRDAIAAKAQQRISQKSSQDPVPPVALRNSFVSVSPVVNVLVSALTLKAILPEQAVKVTEFVTRFVDDYCGTPYPPRPGRKIAEILQVAVELHNVATAVPEGELKADLMEAASKVLQHTVKTISEKQVMDAQVQIPR